MSPLELVRLSPLMQRTSGRPEIRIGLIDGPVAMYHPDLARENVRPVSGNGAAACSIASSDACTHGTFVAGILSAKRGSAAPAICPGCTLLVRPIFPESVGANADLPSAKPAELASAIVETVNAGARVINLSAALVQSSDKSESALANALDYAARHNVIVVAAAGNQGTMGSSCITRHSGVVPVAGCDPQGAPTSESNFGGSIGRNGVLSPSREITSLGTDHKPFTSSGTSAASPFVTGAIALLLSEFPSSTASSIRLAISGANRATRRSVVPPLLDAWGAYEALALTRRNAS